MQAFPEFIVQGKHFCYSLDKPIFADEEVSSPEMMYGHASHQQSMDTFMKKVRIHNGPGCDFNGG